MLNHTHHPHSDAPASYWREVRQVLEQQEGLVAGHNAACDGANEVSMLDLQVLNMQGDIEDVLLALFPETRLDFFHADNQTAAQWELAHSHCSAMVKVTDDFSELYVAHNIWWGYYAMTRIVKEYRIQSAHVLLSSYPGTLSSTDDFYQAQHSQMVIIETTNDMYNNSLYDLIQPQSVFSWIRVTIANRLAHSGVEWQELFKQYNSGTYNNMWMVVDYQLFTPSQVLPAGVLTVCEQLPGLVVCSDQTSTLSRGYWPSFNRAFHPQIRAAATKQRHARVITTLMISPPELRS